MAHNRTKIPHVLFRQLSEIERIVHSFGDCTLPCEEWPHAAHLTVGLWYARESPPAVALDRIRAGIKRYNKTCGVEDTPTGGFDTISQFEHHGLQRTHQHASVVIRVVGYLSQVAFVGLFK